MHTTVRIRNDAHTCILGCVLANCSPNRVLSAYLLGEPTEELIQELREDEAYILERFKRRNKKQNKKKKQMEKVISL